MQITRMDELKMEARPDTIPSRIAYHSWIHDLILALITTLIAWLFLPSALLPLIISVLFSQPIWVLLLIQYVIIVIPLIVMGVYEVRLRPVKIIRSSIVDLPREQIGMPTQLDIVRQTSLMGWLGFRDPHRKRVFQFGLIGGLGLLLIPLIIVTLIVILNLTFLIPTDTDIANVLTPHNVVDLILLLGVVFGANALVEELFFRGYLQRVFSRWLPSSIAIILNSFLFGVFHLSTSPLTAINAFALGIILSLLYQRTNSVYTSWLAHATYNGTLMILNFLLFSLL